MALQQASTTSSATQAFNSCTTTTTQMLLWKSLLSVTCQKRLVGSKTFCFEERCKKPRKWAASIRVFWEISPILST